MTKKHYEAIAGIIKQYVIWNKVNAGDGISLEIADTLADYFATDNPRFNRERFLTACGVLTQEQENNKYIAGFDCDIDQ